MERIKAGSLVLLWVTGQLISPDSIDNHRGTSSVTCGCQGQVDPMEGLRTLQAGSDPKLGPTSSVTLGSYMTSWAFLSL